jgi:xylulose-5-phosphate/fructose-6-phosphate phosphoketolase
VVDRLAHPSDADVAAVDAWWRADNYLTGPGHGGPALVAPGGIPSHVSVPTPGSIHEGGELGYVLVHAFGAVMDNSDLSAPEVIGDGEAETGPPEGSWNGISFLDPERDGAVLPVLHLNGAKIAGPTLPARKDPEEVRSLRTPKGWTGPDEQG